jgi:hypothetical protein
MILGNYVNDQASATSLISQSYTGPDFGAGITQRGLGKFYTIAHGAFPFIWIQVFNVDGANCQWTLSYVGTLYPVTPQPQPTTGTIHRTLTGASNTPIVIDSSYVGQLEITWAVISNATAGNTVTVTCGTGQPTGVQPLIFNAMTVGEVVVLPDTHPGIDFFNQQENSSGYLGCWTGNGIVVTSAGTVDITIGFLEY